MSDFGGPAAPTPPPPPSAGGTGGALPQRGLGDILTKAFEIYKDNAQKLVLIVAVVVVPLTLISALISGVLFKPEVVADGTGVETRGFFIAFLVWLIVLAITVIISAALQAAITRAAAQSSIGDPVDIEASYRWGFGRFGSVLLVSILVGLAVAGGFILLIIPGIIFLVMFSVSIPALVVENRKGTEAMSRSWNLVKGHFWHALGVIVVAGIIGAVVGGIISAIGSAIGSNWFVTWIFSAAGQIIVAPFTALVGVLLYLDLRSRSESLTAETVRTEINTNPA